MQNKKQQVTLSKFFALKEKSRGGNNFNTDEETRVKSKKNSKRKAVNDDTSPSTSNKKSKAKSSNGNSVNDAINLDDHHDDNYSANISRCSGAVSGATLQKLHQFSSELNSDGNREIRTPRNVPDIDRLTVADETKNNSDDADVEITASTSGTSHSRLNQFSNSKSKNSCFSKKSKYTPLELQYMEIKEQYEDAVLFVECGYKYRFFGQDAEIAARVLKIYCHMNHNFMTASIPTHRLFVHVRRLVTAGYKVGVVKQMETAALKAAGDNKNTPFTRKLSALYTKSTLIGEDVDPISDIENEQTEGQTTHLKPNNYLMCIYDGIGEDSLTRNIAIVAIDPATGDVVYDSFIDNEMRGELETRITHINPVELLLPQTLSTSTYRLIEDVVALSSTDDDRIRIEKLNDENFTPEKSQQIIPEFLKNDNQSILQDILNLPKAVLSCIAGLIVYLQDFNLHNILKITGNINRFSIRSKYMQLSGTTLRNLEVFENSSNRSEKGCLFWVLNQTVTRYGNRLLRNWISNPLLRIDEIEKRQEAVHHILCSSHQKLERIKTILSKSPDLEKALCSVYHKKCSVLEFYTVVKSLDKINRELKSLQIDESIFRESRLLSTIIQDIPDLLQDIGDYSQAINEQAAKENDKTNLFNKEGEFPEIIKRKQEIHEVLKDIKDHRRDIRLTLKQPSLEYVTVSQIEFLIEVKNSLIKDVPSDWITISSTKAVTRFHSPFIVSKTQKLSQLKEQLIADANQAWQDFLEHFATNFVRYRKAIQYLATLDCLLSLATIAKQDGYCRPKFVKDRECIEIEEGRHPVITSLLTGQQQYVPNNTHLKDERVMIITGPNMGGKSSYIRQVGLLCMMAQIGSYIPADSAHLSIIDAIYTRMGAADEIFKGRSTFMVELQEASYIMKEATSKSLVILDELGRGTSTHDGLAIAHAALQYFINDVKCFTLFVTHYPSLGGLELSYPGVVGNYHMSFLLHDQEESEDEESITFLYQLVKGQAGKSYGLNVARLADIQPSIIKLAHYQSHHMEANLINTRHEMDMFSDIMNSDSKNLSNILQKVSNDDKGTQSVI